MTTTNAVDAILATAPPLTDEQRDRLARILAGARPTRKATAR